MATNTGNYKLKKPAAEDFYNIEDFNLNADIIDAELYKRLLKPSSFTAGNLASINSLGQIADSGKKAADFLLKGTKATELGGEAAGAAAAVRADLSPHINDGAKHFTAAEKQKLSQALTTGDIVVSSSQPAVQEGRVWIKVV